MDLGALVRNARRLHEVAGRAPLIPMVKADAYGLGLPAVSSAFREALEGRMHAVGVAAVAEGEALRDAGWDGDVIVFSPLPAEEAVRALEARLTVAVSGFDGLRELAEAARSTGRRAVFHTEVDTGMGRTGFHDAEQPEWARKVEAAAGEAVWAGCFTHFHSADEPDLASCDAQWERFQRIGRQIDADRRGSEPLLYHACNSAASIRRPDYRADAVRPGIFLYGGSVGGDVTPEPVASVRSRLTLVREVPRGSTLGYGATYAASRDERWGTVNAGYGDGVPRALWPGGGRALVRGRSVRIIGRISMDVLVVDLTEITAAQAGDVVTLIGRDGEEEIRLDEVADRCGTISYEILTGLTPRLPRVYDRGADD